MKRILGRSGIEVSSVGLGCWAIGGPWNFLGSPAGWGAVDQNEAEQAIRSAMEAGVTFFDTAANYGCGQSERILGQSVKGRRDRVVISTKFGHDVDEANKNVHVYGKSEEESDAAGHMRSDLEKSLKRLQTDYIDIYLLHIWGLSINRALEIRDALEDFVKEGKIRTYGWSTDRVDAVKAFSSSPACGVVEQELNIFECNTELLDLCDTLNLGSINRGPLGMGILTGKYTASSTFAGDDVRKYAGWFAGLRDGRPKQEWLDALEAVKEIITSGGRTPAQGALAWIWARSGKTVPIPGFEGLSAGALRKAAEESLKRLQTDRIDLLYTHIDDRRVPLEETLEALNCLIKEGKVRHIGCSNYRTWRIEKARSISLSNGLAAFCAVQRRYSYLRPKPGSDFGIYPHTDDELLDYLRENPDITLTAYSPLLKGIYDNPEKRKTFDYWPFFEGEDTRARLNTLNNLSREMGVSASSLVLSWLLHHKPAVIPVTGISSRAQLDENLKSLDIRLNEEQMKLLS